MLFDIERGVQSVNLDMWVGLIDSVNVVIIVKHNLHPQESWHGKEQKSSYVLKAMTFVL